MQDGWTALHMAAQEGKVEVVKVLLESQANVNMQPEVIPCKYILIPHAFIYTYTYM